MQVTTTNEKGRYEVQSESKKGEIYLVDLSQENESYGCQCHHYSYKIAPKIDAGATKLTEETTCKHMKQALMFIAVEYCKQFFK